MDNRIKQCYIPDHMEKRFSYFFKKYSLKKYHDRKSPSLFFSGWSMGSIKKHRGMGLVIWRGTESTDDRISRLKKNRNISHVSISSFITEDLARNRVRYKFIPIVGVDMTNFKVCPLGDEIYTYIPDHSSDKYRKRYGMDLVIEIQKRINYKINIITSPNQCTREELLKIYERCFCSFRFTKHDGLPSQVIEMGLMGRKSFYNGDIPGSIRWNKKKIDKIVRNIDKESERIGVTDFEYSNEINKFIDIGTDWLKIKNWRSNGIK